MRRFGMRQVGALAVAASAMTGTMAACGDGSGSGGDVQAGRPADFEPSVHYLGQMVERSTSQPYRFEASMSMSVFDDGGISGFEDVPIMTGSSDGQRTYQRTDVEPFMEEMARQEDVRLPFDLDEVDLAMEVVADEQTVYLRAPDYDVLADAARPGRTPHPLLQAVSDLGDGWGRVDLTVLGDEVLPSEVTNVLDSGQSGDPQQLLDMITQASGVDELGIEEIDGEPMTGLAAELSLVEMLEAQDVDVDAALDEVARRPGAPDDAREVMASMRFAMEVWIDADGHVRRLTCDMGETMRDLADELGEDPSTMAGLFDWRITADFDDYGDQSIPAEIPTPTEAVDLTPTFQALGLSG